MSVISKKTIKLMSKIYLANLLGNIELDNDKSDREYTPITDEETFREFTNEFSKQADRIIAQLEKEIGVKMPTVIRLDELFKFGVALEKRASA